MGRSITPKYRVEVELASARWAATPMAWDTKQDGRANEANLAKLVAGHNASIAPGGANAHLGEEHKIVAARLVRQADDEVVATFGREDA